MRATLIVDAAAVGVSVADWLALEEGARQAIIAEHNSRIDR